jgi:hypothetical protein
MVNKRGAGWAALPEGDEQALNNTAKSKTTEITKVLVFIFSPCCFDLCYLDAQLCQKFPVLVICPNVLYNTKQMFYSAKSGDFGVR